jgi:peptide/nickel transport system substrate-binding protein
LQRDPSVLILLYWQAPQTLNPHLAPGIKDQAASRIAYEPLASYDAEGRMVPFLAAEIPSLDNGGVAADGRSVTWKLRPNLFWADGKPFTAADVVFTYKFATNPEVGASTVSTFRDVASVEAIDERTVKITFKDVNPAWSIPFVGVQGAILPEHVFAPFNGPNAKDADVNMTTVGTGPYQAVEFRTEDVLLIGEDVVNTVRIIYQPNPRYRDLSKLAFKQVELQGGGDASVASAAVLREGLVDFAWNLAIPDAQLKELETAGKGKVVATFGAYVERIMINFTDPNRETDEGERSSTQFPHPVLSALVVRQALAHAIDREKIADLYGRTGRVTDNILVSPPGYASSAKGTEFDPAAAAKLLDAAGWTDSDGDGVRDKEGQPLALTFQTSINPTRQQTLDIVAADLAKIGVQIEKKLIESSIFLGPGTDNTNTRRHFYADLEEYAYGNKSPDPGAYMRGWLCQEAAQMKNGWSGPNWGRYCNPEYEALLKASAAEMDPDARSRLFQRMNELLMQDAAVIPLVHWADVNGISVELEGFSPTPWDSEVWNIAEWHRR